MNSGERKQLLEQLTSIWMRAFEDRRFEDALFCSFANYLISREAQDEEYQKTCLIALKGAVDGLLPESEVAKDECSFCGRRPPEVRLAAGPRAFICNECVAMLTQEVFARPA